MKWTMTTVLILAVALVGCAETPKKKTRTRVKIKRATVETADDAATRAIIKSLKHPIYKYEN